MQPHQQIHSAQPAVGLTHPDATTACGPLLEALTSAALGQHHLHAPHYYLCGSMITTARPAFKSCGFCADMHSLRGSSSNLPPATGCCSACIWIHQVVQQRSRARVALVPPCLGVQQQRQVVQRATWARDIWLHPVHPPAWIPVCDTAGHPHPQVANHELQLERSV